MSTKPNDITLVPRNRKSLLDDEFKYGQIDLTRDEKVKLAAFVGTPEWSIIKNLYCKQRAAQIAFTSFNVSTTNEQIEYYRGAGGEITHFYKDIEKIVADFNKEEESKKSKS